MFLITSLLFIISVNALLQNPLHIAKTIYLIICEKVAKIKQSDWQKTAVL